MIKKGFILATIITTSLLISCRKDNVEGVVTPYQINYPEIFSELLPPMEIPEDNPLTEEGILLGRKLFYDNILSADNTQSCSSCHSPENSFTDSDQFSKGIDGLRGNRNSMAIINLGWSRKFFWDGRANSLEEQAFGPVVNPIEMHNTWPNVVTELQNHPEYPSLFKAAFNTFTVDSVLVSKALTQFERTLISGNSPVDRYLRNEPTGLTFNDEIMMIEGLDMFLSEDRGDCAHCHGDPTNPLWTDNLFHNNGLDEMPEDYGLELVTGNEFDRGKFKTPTLRNLVFTAPYMHDGRFKTLEEVIDHYSVGLKNSPYIDPLMKNAHNGGLLLKPDDKKFLIKFLECLTDSSLVTNPEFQKP